MMVGRKVYRAARVIDGKSDGPLLDGAVVVENRRIAKVGPWAEVSAGIETANFGDATIMPGLVDAHVHLADDGSDKPRSLLETESSNLTLLRCARRAFETLRSGVTTIRDMGAPSGLIIDLRDAIDVGVIPGPRILTCDRALTITGGYGKKVDLLGREVDGVHEAQKATRENFKIGADFVKVMATGKVFAKGADPGEEQFTEQELAVIVFEAHKARKRTAAHAIGLKGIQNVVRAGFDTIEHANYLDKDTAEIMVQKGIYLVPTLFPFFIMANPPDGIRFDKHIVTKAKRVWDVSLKAIEIARAAGVKIVAGTDSGGPCIPHNSLIKELVLLRSAGISNMGVLKSATSIAAEAIGTDGDLGSLHAGKLANITIVRGNPLANIEALRDVLAVVKEGTEISLESPSLLEFDAATLPG